MSKQVKLTAFMPLLLLMFFSCTYAQEKSKNKECPKADSVVNVDETNLQQKDSLCADNSNKEKWWGLWVPINEETDTGLVQKSNLPVFETESDPYQFSFEKFDKELFEKNKYGDEYDYEDGENTIRLMGSNDGYTKVVISGVYEYTTTYYKKELTVKQTGMRIYTMIAGSLKYYDVHGNLVKTDDRDAPFHFAIEDVVKLVKEKYGVDMLEKKFPNKMSRSDEPYPYYMVLFVTPENKCNLISIDGVDGTIFYYAVNDKIIIDEGEGNDDYYLMRKAKQKAASEKK